MCKFENKIIRILCPYCSFFNELRLSMANYYSINTVWCDIENGGCDELFGYSVETINVVTSTYTMEKVNV